MTANEIYNKALTNGVSYETDCVGCGIDRWDELMKGATRADKRKVHKILVESGELDKETLKYRNPYDYYKTQTHLICVHSGIEYFYKINS